MPVNVVVLAEFELEVVMAAVMRVAAKAAGEREGERRSMSFRFFLSCYGLLAKLAHLVGRHVMHQLARCNSSLTSVCTPTKR